jgi:hypothetical protein
MSFRRRASPYDLYRLRLGTGVALALPAILAVFWYAWSAYGAIDRYRRAAEPGAEVSFELFHISLYDELTRDLRRISLPPRPSSSRLPTYELSLTRAALDDLHADPVEGADPYSAALVRKDGRVHEARVRFRGGQHWNVLGAQKSLKVRIDRGDLIDGTRIFNLLNDPTPFGLEQEIILGISSELGLLTPEYHAAWVRLNNSDLGVYRYEAQPEEGLLRRSRRMPGSMYSGDTDAIDPARGTGALFFGRAGWKKVAWAKEEEKESFAELDRLLAAIVGTHAELVAYRDQEINLERYAMFDALDVVFGCNDHDYGTNHKLYFDPYSGRFEPVAWAFRGFHHEERFNLVENPLLLRLAMSPGYLALRDRFVYALLTGEASPQAVRARAEQEYAALAGDLDADPYWDAYKLLPRASKLHRFMVRPMTRQRWALAAEEELGDLATRSRYLLDVLEAPSIAARWEPGPSIAIEVGGHGAYRFARAKVESGGCTGEYGLVADVDRDRRRSPADVTVARGPIGTEVTPATYVDLWPGVVLVPHDDPKPSAGRVSTAPEARTYRYLIEGACAPARIEVVFESSITGASTSIRLDAPADAADPQAERPASPDVAPALEPGDRSPHPWSFPPSPPEALVRLGPGTVEYAESRAFGPNETVEIEAGTRILLGPKATLSFRGPVRARGTAVLPIAIERLDPAEAFGGVVLQGPRTAGSRWSHLRITGGSAPSGGPVDYPGLVDIHHTSDVVLDHVVLERAAAEDLLHVHAVGGLTLEDVVARDATMDAIDIELSTARVRGLRVERAGDDCLDVMGSNVRFSDSLLSGCVNNAVSAGEETALTAHGVVIARSHAGVLAKNASEARIGRSLIYQAAVAFETNRKDVHYDRPSSISASDMIAADCEELSKAARGTRIETGHVQVALPENGGSRRLRDLLPIDDWSRIDAVLDGGAP